MVWMPMREAGADAYTGAGRSRRRGISIQMSLHVVWSSGTRCGYDFATKCGRCLGAGAKTNRWTSVQCAYAFCVLGVRRL